MRIWNHSMITDGVGCGPCVRPPVPAARAGGVEPIPVQTKRLAALDPSAALPVAGEITDALARLWQDMQDEMLERAGQGEFACAADAVMGVTGELSAQLGAAADPYLRARAADITDIGECMLRQLQETAQPSFWPRGAVLTTAHLTVFDALDAIKHGVAAVLTGAFSPLSHAAILLRGAGIPVAYGRENWDCVADGTCVLVDGIRGQVVLEPDGATLRAALEQPATPLPTGNRVQMADGTEFQIDLNCGGSWERIPPDVEIGLLRTEFFYAQVGRLPTESELTAEYGSIVRRCRRTTIRLLDAGADKPVPGLNITPAQSAMPQSRGISLLLKNPVILRTQLRAILRAAACGAVQILIPMVTVPEEVEAVRACLRDCAAELKKSGLAYCEDVPVGVMIETPSAAVLSADLARIADFASIGTNDLTQYVTASDRTQCEPGPAVLRLIHSCVRAFQAVEKPIGVCGEIASDSRWLRELAALGVRRVSVPAGSLGQVQQEIKRLCHMDEHG